MSESRRPDADLVNEAAPRAERVLAWLAARDEVEEAFRDPLDRLPGERDDRMARMADILQATAQGLGPRAAAVWAGVPEQLVRQWLAHDEDFALAVQAASNLAAAHGLEPGGTTTPAMIRVVILAMSKGHSWAEATDIAGIGGSRLRRMWRSSPALVSLVDAARRTRSRKPKTYVPPSYRPRKPGRAAPTSVYRLVRREDP
ncbi:hypothetical protein ACGFYV_04300 [Streptomyces sp. NPDC048297]|uniref:hypothetical protein n=1 Tax=Streptomyces sp. NPDC048297 TaxID=3365531 RepID=UPI003711C815